jgi:hypothetical protein
MAGGADILVNLKPALELVVVVLSERSGKAPALTGRNSGFTRSKSRCRSKEQRGEAEGDGRKKVFHRYISFVHVAVQLLISGEAAAPAGMA